ncbi:MAG: SEL1-like repeat protein [Gammaproteobacteria bacterium]|nr:SEL1-like repeat protein [Gammaproteobacteria bacterium]
MRKRYLVIGLSAVISQALFAAQNYHTALDAQVKGDYTSAALAWQQLATAGDPVAQYNLAMLYQHGQGVKADVATAQHWLTLAARQGLTEAYKQLNNNSVQPSAGITANKNTVVSASPVTGVEPKHWVQSLGEGKYTVQLVSTTDEDIVLEYYKNVSLGGKAGYFPSRRQGQVWYTLVYGNFDTVAEANLAVAQLPADLKKWSPWIRNVADIQRMIK